ncbi:HlyD family secretion protein [uncultured Clostridium sp.]|uniref:HlyD family secretion protein n=1 Tax=uncultured Clostridium sp. TaxID=59620 RepID=UPI0025D8201C|nr:efflux RND transporter periplasmic adaptor subunit [uncultured Clostridium sp.]
MKLKKLSGLFLILLAANGFTACNLPFAHATGDEIVAGKADGLVVQSNIKMEESNVNSLTGGQILEVLVSEGDTVTKGQPLVSLDCDSLQAQRAQAQAGVDQAKAALGQAQAGKAQAEAALQKAKNGATEEEINQLKSAINIAQSNVENAQSAYDVAKASYDRTKALYDAGAATQVELEGKEMSLQNAQTGLDNAKSNLNINNEKYNSAVKGATPEDIAQAQAGVDQAQAGVGQAEAAVQQAEAAVQQIDVTLEKCSLVSPVDGVVTSLNVKNGDLVSSGMPVVVVTDTYNPSITCNIKETELDKVEMGQEVSIKIPAYEDKEFKGKVTNINKNADFATKKATNDNGDFDILSYGVKVEFEDFESLKETGIDLRANMTSFVDFGK